MDAAASDGNERAARRILLLDPRRDDARRDDRGDEVGADEDGKDNEGDGHAAMQAGTGHIDDTAGAAKRFRARSVRKRCNFATFVVNDARAQWHSVAFVSVRE
jgi:hypothetical protein